jgi:hypothetical protein
MQAFARRGFQLRTASTETRLTYTGFLLLMLPGVASLIALSLGRMGLNPQAIATYYRGSESEMSFPKTFWQLTEVSHFHLFTIPVVALILSHLLYGTAARPRVRIGLTVVLYTGALLDVLGPWAIRYLAAGFAYVLLLGWLLLGAGLLAVVLFTLFAMWLPPRVRPALANVDTGVDRP